MRENTLLPAGARQDRPDYDFLDELELGLFALGDGAEASAVVHGPDGAERARFTAKRRGQELLFERTGGQKLSVRIRQTPSARVVAGGSVLESGPAGTLIAWLETAKELSVALA